METHWMQVGREYHEDRRDEVRGYLDRMEWREVDEGIDAPMMVGEGIKACIRELTLPRVTAVAWSHDMAPFGLYAIRANYKNGQVELFVCDHGDGCAPLCSRYWAPEMMSLERLSDWTQARAA